MQRCLTGNQLVRVISGVQHILHHGRVPVFAGPGETGPVLFQRKFSALNETADDTYLADARRTFKVEYCAALGQKYRSLAAAISQCPKNWIRATGYAIDLRALVEQLSQ